jgi:iron(III) transport system permease protein
MICGANQSTIARKIVIPLLQPTILLGVILVFVRTVEDFGTPALLGSGKIFTLATAMYFSLSSQSFTGIPRYGVSAAIGIFLLLIIILPLVLGRRIVYRGGRSFYLVSGKGSKIRRKNLRAFRYVAFLAALIYVLFSSVLVFGATLIRSFYVFVGGPVTLSNYDALIDVPLITRSIVNSIILAVAGAGLTMLFGLGLSYVSHRTNVRGRSLLDILGAVPTIIPGLVLGLGALWFWSFTPLLSSLIAVIVTVMIRFLPYSLNTLAASFDSIDISLDEAGRVIGASLPTTFRKITAPLMRNGFIYGYSILYGYFMIELATPLFLAGATTEVMPVVAYIYTIDGFYGEASAIVMVNMLMILPVILFLWRQRKSALLATPISV